MMMMMMIIVTVVNASNSVAMSVRRLQKYGSLGYTEADSSCSETVWDGAVRAEPTQNVLKTDD